MNGSTEPVLLAFDGSQSSATAIAVAGRLLSGRRALVCHVSREALEAGDAIAAEGVRLARAAGFDAESLPLPEHRKTWRTLLEAAGRCDAAVVVAGAQGLSGFGRAVLGSVSTALVHHSPRPVLVVPATVTEEATDGPLLLCYDGSEVSARAIAAARDLFQPRSAVVLHSWESWVVEVPAFAGLSGTVRGTATELDELGEDLSADITSRGVALAERAGLEVTGLSERATGPVWKAVLDAGDEHSSAAVVVGSRGLSGLSAALGSVSNGVLHHSRRPVLVVPPGEDT